MFHERCSVALARLAADAHLSGDHGAFFFEAIVENHLGIQGKIDGGAKGEAAIAEIEAVGEEIGRASCRERV